MLAPFYSNASLDERVDMKTMTAALDYLREVFETNDPSEAWSNIRLDHSTFSGEPYSDYLLQLKRNFFDFATDKLITRIQTAAKEDAEGAFREWQIEYATALTWLCDPVYSALCTAEFPFTPSQQVVIKQYRDINDYILDRKWPETWSTLCDLADNTLFDANLRSNLKIMAGEVKLFWLPDYRSAIDLFNEARDLSPENPRVERSLGEYYGRVGENEKAKDHFLMAISRKPNDIETYIGMGNIFLSEGNRQAAEQWYRDAMKVNFFETSPYSMIVSLYNTKKGIEENSAVIERYVDIAYKLDVNPDTGNSLYNFLREVAMAYSTATEYDIATRYYERAIALKPELSAAKIDLGYNLSNAKQYDAAKEWLLRSLRQDEKWNFDTHWALGWMYEQLGDAEHATPDDKERNYRLAMHEYEQCASIRKLWTDRCYNLIAILYYRLGMHADAVKYYDMAISINPTEKVYYNNKLDALRKAGSDPQRLEEALKAVCDHWPDDADAHNSLGVFYHDQGDYRSAIVAYIRAIDLNPAKAVFFENRGLAYSYLGELDNCERDYLQSLKLNENDAILNKLGILYYRRKDYVNAIQYYEKAIALHDSDPVYYENLGLAYEESRKEDEAVAAYERAMELEKVKGTYANRLGIFYYSRGNGERAIEYYRMALEREPDRGVYLGNMGLALEQLHRDDEAGQYYAKALSLDGNDALAKSRLAVINMRRGIFDDTIYHQLTGVLQSDPNNLRYLEYLGHYYERTGQSRLALQIYERALSIDPDDEYFNNRVGVVLYNMATPEGAEKAIPHYKKAIAKHQSTRLPSMAYLSVYWQNLGLAYEETGQIAEAESAYLTSIGLDPGNDEHLNRVGVFFNNKVFNYNKALEFYEKAASIKEKAVYFNNMGYAYELLNEHVKANAAYEKARTLEAHMGQATSL